MQTAFDILMLCVVAVVATGAVAWTAGIVWLVLDYRREMRRRA